MLRIALFYHSLVSDWNHGNAHFLRGIASELLRRGHQVDCFEPEDSWSRTSLTQEYGEGAIRRFQTAFPALQSRTYAPDSFDPVRLLDNPDLILVHEWNHPKVVAELGTYRRRHPQTRLLFHDTHHRAVSAPEELARLMLDEYDGVLAYGESLRDAYLKLGWAQQVQVWHEAADVNLFYPREIAEEELSGDLVWIGNWGDNERAEELREFLLQPVHQEQLTATIYGVRYPDEALKELRDLGIAYGGWLPNFEVPDVFAQYRVTVHVPRRPYVRLLPGIPTIRVFEALACGIPLISSPWDDTEHLFRGGVDFLQAGDSEQMRQCLRDILNDATLATSLAKNGLETIRKRHTCAHRANELLNCYQRIAPVKKHAEVYQ